MNQEETAYRAIIRMILRKQVRPGDSLLETAIAESLGLSRTPVSHALGRLLAEGFLEKRSKRGYVIPFPSPEDARHVFAVRRLMEGEAAAEAANAIRPEEMAALDRSLKDSDDSVRRRDPEGFSTTNETFHLGIARLSRNPYLERYVRQTFWRSNLYIFFFDGFYQRPGNSVPVQKTPDQHRRIVDAIKAKDAEMARRCMDEHIAHSYQSLVSALKP
jgi:DNA-binding GntR family transcriptional regulator